MYSFDIFDTLITRTTADPKGVFLLMQEAMKEMWEYDSFLLSNFYELRIGAESLARKYARLQGKQEVTLNDIYYAMATTTCVTEEQLEELKKLEVKTEYNNVLGLSKNIDLLKRLKDKGHHLILVSDMYLCENCIRSILCHVDSIFSDIPIYVSSDYGKTKGSGDLFRLVKEREHIAFSDWIHYGDNEYADIKAALKLGIQAIYLPQERLMEYEQPQKDFYHQLSVGVAKYIRTSGQRNTAWEVGCSLGGPVLYPYVSWVVEKSMEMGLTRLYFVARDGWILQQIADILIRIRQYPIKTYYIYGSRKAWRLPSFEGSKEDFDRIVRWSNMDEVLSLDDLAEVFRLKVNELVRFLPDDYKDSRGDEKLLNIQVLNLCQRLRENCDFLEYLVKSQEGNRRLVIQYLQQQIDTSDSKFAFVELSGTGLTQICLARIIKNFFDGRIWNFYFKLDSIQKEEYCQFINFYPSDLSRSYMLELLCRAPHGQTEGYIQKCDRIVPALEQIEGKMIIAYHIEDYRDAVLEYVGKMEQAYVKNGWKRYIRVDVIRDYLNLIAVNPPKRVAEYFCHMPFSAGGRKNAMVEFAPEVSNRQLREIYFWNNGRNYQQIYSGSCLEYALVVSNKAAKYAEKCRKYRKTLIGRWLIRWNQYFHVHQRPDGDFFCSWEYLKGKVIIYGAGQVGQAYVKQARKKYAECDSLLWVDSNYSELQKSGMMVESPEKIMEFPFDRIIIAIHNTEIKKEIWEKLRKMGVESEKIYYG